jgi:hypothetical protein
VTTFNRPSYIPERPRRLRDGAPQPAWNCFAGVREADSIRVYRPCGDPDPTRSSSMATTVLGLAPGLF